MIVSRGWIYSVQVSCCVWSCYSRDPSCLLKSFSFFFIPQIRIRLWIYLSLKCQTGRTLPVPIHPISGHQVQFYFPVKLRKTYMSVPADEGLCLRAGYLMLPTELEMDLPLTPTPKISLSQMCLSPAKIPAEQLSPVYRK